MKILFVAHRTPFPPNKGEKIRAYHFLTELVKRHTVSLLYWLDDVQDVNHVDVLRRMCQGPVVPIRLTAAASIVRGSLSLLCGRSFSEGYFHCGQFQSAFNELVQNQRPDVVFVFSSAMAAYLRGLGRIPVIVDFVDVDSEKWGQMAEFKKAPFSLLCELERRRLGKFERKISKTATCSLFVSHAEADSFKTLGGTGHVAVIPNGVESEVRRLPVRNVGKQGRNVIAPKMVFVGTMNYFPNIDAVLNFVQNTWPLVRKEYRRAEFHVVGRCPPRCIRTLDGSDGIRVFGEVPNVAPYLLGADVSVAPLRIARGVQNKILEAMAIGVPVVASTQAVKGIQVEGEVDILVADDPVDFAGQVIRILQDSELYQAIVSRARNRVFENYSWQNIGTQLEQILAGLVKSAPAEFVQARPG